MAHIAIREGIPGIQGLFGYDPEAARSLCDLAEIVLRRSEGLSRGERELIATYVSTLNQCIFCATSHAAVARHLLGDGDLVQAVQTDPGTAPISEKVWALLAIATRVQGGGRSVTEENVAAARQHGATDAEIHDTVLIAAAFCMYNRYVDGLAVWTPEAPEVYEHIGARLAASGYVA